MNKFRVHQNVIFAVVGLLVFLLLFVADSYYKDLLIKTEKANYQDKAELVTSSLSTVISSRFALLVGLKTFTKTILVPESKTKKKRDFESFAAGLYSSTKGIRIFAVAPKGINTFVYPIERNQKAIGHNLLKDKRPNVRADVQRTILEREMVLSGPYELRQGGLGLVCRMAIFEDDAFWGLVAMVLDMQPILDEANLLPAMQDYRFTLIGNDGKVFWGDESVLDARPILTTISLPDGKWELALLPTAGWGHSFIIQLYVWRISLIVTTLAIIFLFYSLSRQQRRLEQAIIKKTKMVGQSEARLNFALQVSQTGMWDLNLQDHTVTQTLLHDQIFGYEDPLPDWTYEMFLEHVLPKDRAKTDRLFQEALATRTAWGLECRINRVDGEMRWIHVCGDQQIDKDGQPLNMTGVVRDITERKEAELALLQSEERFSYAMNATQDGLYDWNLITNGIYYSPAWKSMLGYAYDELPNDFSVWEELTDPEDVKLSWMMLEQLINKELERFEIEFRMKHKQGHWVDILSRAKAFFDSEGQAVRVVGTHQDISERISMEHQLAIAQKLEAIGQLASGVAHEINTPIQYIAGNLKFMRDTWAEIGEELKIAKQSESTTQDDSLPVEETPFGLAQEYEQAIIESIAGVDQISKIVQAMKQLAHPDTASSRSIDINEIIKNSVIITKNEWKYVAEVVMNLDENIPYILCNPSEISQVVLILLVNSAHAIAMGNREKSDKGLITLTTFQENGMVVLSVQDDGCGILKQNMTRVFDQFFTTKEPGKGTGQGLAIAHSIISNHKGSIVLNSQEDVGTTFTVRLPLKRK